MSISFNKVHCIEGSFVTLTRAVWAVFILWLWAPALAHALTPQDPGNGDAQPLKIKPIVLTNQERAWIKAYIPLFSSALMAN